MWCWWSLPYLDFSTTSSHLQCRTRCKKLIERSAADKALPVDVNRTEWSISNCDSALGVSIGRHCTIESTSYVCTKVDGIVLYEQNQPSPLSRCLDGRASWGFCQHGEFLCTFHSSGSFPSPTLHGLHETRCEVDGIEHVCSSLEKDQDEFDHCASDCLGPEASSGICKTGRLCNAEGICARTRGQRCIPTSDLIVRHKCINQACLLRDVKYDRNWTSTVCPDRLCFGCSAVWSDDKGKFECTLRDAHPTMQQDVARHIDPVFARDCSQLSRLRNGRESLPLGIPAFFDPPVACEKVISRAVLIYVDGWNPYHQVLQTFRLLFDALVSFSVNGDQYSAGLTDCVILLSEKNTHDEVGPFGSNVLSSFCTNGIVELKRFRTLCFSELLLGATPGGWDMPIDSEYPVTVNFGGIYMAQWVKKRLAAKFSDFFVAPKKLGVNNSVTLVLRRGRRAFNNEVDVIQSMTCKTGSCNHSILTIDFDQSTFQEGVNVVSRSIVLVGVHGAGLTNLIFLPVGGALVELRLQKSRSAYVQLCRSFGKLHVEFRGTKMVSPPSGAWSVQDDRDLLVHVVEPEKLGSLVSNTIDVVQSRSPACC